MKSCTNTWEQIFSDDIQSNLNTTWFDLWNEYIKRDIALKSEGCDSRERGICPETAYTSFKIQESLNSGEKIQQLSLAGQVSSLSLSGHVFRYS